MPREDDETRPTPTAKPATVAGEAIRIRHTLERLRSQLHSLELVVNDAERLGIPPGHEASQALVSTSFEIVTGLAKVDVLIRAKS